MESISEIEKIDEVISNAAIAKTPRKSIATIEVCERKASFSLETKQDGQIELARKDRKMSMDLSRMTYAEYYLKTKRSGSLAIPLSQYTDKQLKGGNLQHFICYFISCLFLN